VWGLCFRNRFSKEINVERLNVLDENKKLLKANEVADLLNISKALAYRMMQVGRIRTVQIGKSRRVRPVDLNIFINNNLTQENLK
jgi:excisionase family DNA binding protein